MKTEAVAVQIVIRFNEALNARDVDTMMSLMTAERVFENTSPAPDGTRYQGQAAVRAFWADFFRTAQGQQIEFEEISAWEDRCVMRWRYMWHDANGNPGHIRGIDLYKLEAGKIVGKTLLCKGLSLSAHPGVGVDTGMAAQYIAVGHEFDNPSLPHYNSAMNTPFLGMDPYLEHPTLWADVHDTAPPTPPLAPDDAQWAQALLAA